MKDKRSVQSGQKNMIQDLALLVAVFTLVFLLNFIFAFLPGFATSNRRLAHLDR